MPLTNKQYDAIMRGYDRRQYRNYREQRARTEEIYEKIPRIREIDEAVSASSLSHAEQIFSLQERASYQNRAFVLKDLKERLSALREEKETLLVQAGYSSDYLDMHYTCPDCQDTGYIGRKKCRCFQREEIRLLYSSSRLETVLSEENFSTLSFDVYDEEQKAVMPAIIRLCRDFVDSFAEAHKSLHFYGPVGTGKTFLSNCIAKELLNRGYSVIYFTAFQLFELFSSPGSTDTEIRTQNHEALLESDLLILDDIGTELANTFTVSRLFQILNERALRRKSTILSTNLSLKDFRDIYSERIFSRITSSYTPVKFCGSDIRIRKKISRSV
ncbi:MAG: ATP-binding protein [Lachnospiraceae bacterium]|nr:ATP-binding protein [Lachnospiraceae bacterium]